jgi:predicted TPR repeat methyltransferase
MHTEMYVRRTLTETGFDAIAVETDVLRREGETYVAGLIVSARLRA